jgi:hypothetical protein
MPTSATVVSMATSVGLITTMATRSLWDMVLEAANGSSNDDDVSK